MLGMILAAGRGERMRPLTDTTPKPLLFVGTKRLIEYHIESFARANIRHIIINVWYFADQIQKIIGDGQQYGVTIQYSVENKLLGTGGGIYQALPLLGNAPFVVVSADIFTDFPFETLPRELMGLAHLVMADKPDYLSKSDFDLEGGVLVPQTEQRLTFGNIGVYHPDFFDAFDPAYPELRNLFDKHIAKRQITGQHYPGRWYNIGTPAELEKVEYLLRSVP